MRIRGGGERIPGIGRVHSVWIGDSDFGAVVVPTIRTPVLAEPVSPSVFWGN